jgi:hypothetical protein
MANLAFTYSNQGQWKEAEGLFIQVMESRKRLLGEEHPDTLTSMANLASTYRNQEQWKEAEKLDVQVMKIRNTLPGRSNLGQGANTKWAKEENSDADRELFKVSILSCADEWVMML